MNNIGVIGGADGTTQIVVSGSIGGLILWIFFGALALMVILYAAFYRRGKGKAVCLALAAVFCVAADQAVKFLVVNTMSPANRSRCCRRCYSSRACTTTARRGRAFRAHGGCSSR